MDRIKTSHQFKKIIVRKPQQHNTLTCYGSKIIKNSYFKLRCSRQTQHITTHSNVIIRSLHQNLEKTYKIEVQHEIVID